ncbi:MAG: hypothetical protein E7476_03665 [Ruminococcaceae bacterium]|nr:hypothetical protein [Oscillospiraceae bacterium]
METIKWMPKRKIEKYRLGENKPYAVEELIGNLLLEGGANNLLRLLIGDGTATPFNASAAHIGIGDGTDAAVSTQTGLQGANKTYKPMDTSYPVVYGNAVTFKATFNASDAVYAWNELCVIAGGYDEALCLNRKVESHGEKPDNEIWYVTCTIALS